MRYFLLAFSMVLILSACSDSGSDNHSPYPVQIGAFSLKSESQAQWTGTALRYKTGPAIAAHGDTTYINRPDSLTMQVIADHADNGGFGITINDSTITQQFLIDNDMDISAHEITDFADNGIDFKGGSTGGGYDLVNVQFVGTYHCDSTYSADNTQLVYSLRFADSGEHFKTWILDIGGFRAVLNRIVCHQPF